MLKISFLYKTVSFISFSILLFLRIIKKSKDTITLKSELVVIKLSSLCKNVVGGEFSTKLKGYGGQNGGWAIAVELPQTIYVIKIEMAQGYYLFCKKIILKIF